MQQPDGLEGHKRRLLGRLRHDGVARSERCGDLPGENCQRKIPWADADEHPAAPHAQFVGFACRTRQGLWRKHTARVLRIEPAIVDRLAHLGNTIVDRLARLALQQRDQAATILLKQVARAFERCGALGDGSRTPRRESSLCGCHRSGNQSLIAFLHGADNSPINRRVDRTFTSGHRRTVDQWFCVGNFRGRTDFGSQRFKRSAVAKFDTG